MAENASAAAHASATAARTRAETRTHTPSYEGYQILHVAFTIAPLIAGADKFFHFLVNWDQYLSPMVARMLPIPAHTFTLASASSRSSRPCSSH